MKKTRMMIVFLSILCLSILAGCATKVTRVDVEEKIDLSGGWNDYDAMLVSEEMIKDCLARPWLAGFVKQNERDPIVIVGHIANRSHEHINVQVFVKYLERELLNSGKVIFVASPEEREQVRGEREDQQMGLTDEATITEMGKERGADFMLIGSVNSVRDETKRKSAILYQVNLELVDLTTNQKAWIGQKDIKKFIERSRFSL